MDHRPALNLALASWLVFAAAPAAPAAEPDAVEVIKRATARVLANEDYIHNYTCVQTVNRDYFVPAAPSLPRSCGLVLAERRSPPLDMVLHLEFSDRLRLEVTTSERGEIFSWVGAGRFDERGVDHLVRQGPMATGIFANLLGVVFERDVKHFEFEGVVTVEGRRLMAYTFEVPRAASHYQVRLVEGGAWYISAYRGRVLVDPETADPVRLSVETAELPIATGSCQTVSSLEYGRVQIGDHRLLLANRSAQRFIGREGRETENTTAFSACREYSSESTVTFYREPDPHSDSSLPAPSPVPRRISAGVRFAFELVTPIDTDTAAAGDPFAGKLTEPLRDGKHRLAPKGARVEGHLSQVEVIYRPAPQVLLGLRPETVEIQGARVALDALPTLRSLALLRQQRKNRGLEIYLPPPGEFSGVFRFPGAHVVFRRGFVSEWLTLLRAGLP